MTQNYATSPVHSNFGMGGGPVPPHRGGAHGEWTRIQWGKFARDSRQILEVSQISKKYALKGDENSYFVQLGLGLS